MGKAEHPKLWDAPLRGRVERSNVNTRRVDTTRTQGRWVSKRACNHPNRHLSHQHPQNLSLGHGYLFSQEGGARSHHSVPPCRSSWRLVGRNASADLLTKGGLVRRSGGATIQAVTTQAGHSTEARGFFRESLGAHQRSARGRRRTPLILEVRAEAPNSAWVLRRPRAAKNPRPVALLSIHRHFCLPVGKARGTS